MILWWGLRRRVPTGTMIWSICSASHFHRILKSLLKLSRVVERCSMRWVWALSHESLYLYAIQLLDEWRVPREEKDSQEKSMVTTATWKLLMVQKIKMLSGNSFRLWVTAADEILDLSGHPRNMAFDCQSFIPCPRVYNLFTVSE